MPQTVRFRATSLLLLLTAVLVAGACDEEDDEIDRKSVV